MRHLRIKTDQDNLIHSEGTDDHTLCGLDACGDSQLGIEQPKETNRKINCPDCIQIIRFCWSIRRIEIKE
jgi:hypothetical protein